MKIIFMGTPDFAVPSLKILTESMHSIIAVVTGVDKERGRGQRVAFTPVKNFATENGIPVLQPEKLKDPDFADKLRLLAPDIIVVVAFRILPESVFTIPRCGSFNLHASLLPKYRGAAPIQWALINGEKKTGVTTFKLEQKVDTGNVYLMKEVEIEDDDDMGSLHDKLSFTGAEAVLETVNMIDSGNYTLEKQVDSEATPAPKISNEMGQIDWNKPAFQIHNLVRAFSPAPGAYFIHNNRQIKVYKTKISVEVLPPGKIEASSRELLIGCGEGSLQILEIQQEGKKRMDIESFLRGYRF